jgi:hypothetical protein
MLDTLKSRTRLTGAGWNVRLTRLLRNVITPVVLLAGLLILAVVHFQGVLKVTTAQSDLYRGITAYSVGPLNATFQHNAGTDRPNISYDNTNLLTYVDWNSTISIDGHVENLWDNFHGYSQDDTKRQIFATTSGYGWQVVEIITAVDAHTVTVQYDFVAVHEGTAEPQHVVLTIVHTHKTWYQPTVNGNTFTAQVLPGSVSTVSSGTRLHGIGTLTLALSGPDVPQNAISITDLRSTFGPDGTQQSLANTMTTMYALDNPQVDRLVPLGTETITFTPQTPTGTPIAAPVATP